MTKIYSLNGVAFSYSPSQWTFNMKIEHHSKLETVLSKHEHEPDDVLLNLCPEHNRGDIQHMSTKIKVVAPYQSPSALLSDIGIYSRNPLKRESSKYLPT